MTQQIRRLTRPIQGLLGNLGDVIPQTKTSRIPIKILYPDGVINEVDLNSAKSFRESLLGGLSLEQIYKRSLPRLTKSNFDPIFEEVYKNKKMLPSLKRAGTVLARHLKRLYYYLGRLNESNLSKEKIEVQCRKAFACIAYYQEFLDAILGIEKIIQRDVKDADKIAEEIQQIKFGERLKIARANTEKTVRQMAEIVGIPYAELSRYENGRKSPSFKTLLKLIAAYKTSANWLLQGRD